MVVFDLEDARKRLERGDKSMILNALFLCLAHDLPVPKWLMLAFVKAYARGMRYEIDSWEEVFGPPIPKGTQRKNRRKHVEVMLDVWQLVQDRSAAGQPIGDKLFKEVGRVVGVSGPVTRKLYYENRRLCAVVAQVFSEPTAEPPQETLRKPQKVKKLPQ